MIKVQCGNISVSSDPLVSRGVGGQELLDCETVNQSLLVPVFKGESDVMVKKEGCEVFLVPIQISLQS